jgi:acetyl-CoA acetyltransferase
LTDNGYLRDTPITKDDVLNSPMAATPNRMLNCAVFTDGAVAFIVTSSERAKAWGQKAVTVLAAEQLFGSGTGLVSDDISTVTSLLNIREGARVSVNRAYAKTGLNANTVDLFYSYDPFSFVPVMYFEALGLCGDGEGGDFVRDGNVAPGGSVWANTHGGLCAFGQPGVGGGTWHLIEACKQLRHEAGPRQKPDAQTAIYVGEGANWSTYPVTVLLRGQP